ncbi:hypothetical protein [Thalassospira xiamenensis]|uniref:Uncharacterized protein n=1 Tax=Thalassospira xiamenensis TaxID=220697 RepID=A0A285TXV0_9PROT|nr:hypothetical protein [Thalassospira xiamenensis]SOC30557.1 hypothetical protein SAMN05428964_109105 [Thalassospira xiamenensis]
MDLFTSSLAAQGLIMPEGYTVLRIDAATCSPELANDLQGHQAARWLASALRFDFEQACYGAKIYGPCGTFDGVIADSMPGYWRNTEETVGGKPVWVPDSRHPVGKLFSEMAARLLPMPPLEVLDGILRKHSIEGSSSPSPVYKEFEGGWAVMIHKLKPKSLKQPGVSIDEELLSLWKQEAPQK